MSVPHRTLGAIYPPHYNLQVAPGAEEPEIYNRQGERMRAFFIRDAHFAHNPYYFPSPPTKFLFDRFNIGLDTHFYSNGAMLETMGHPTHRYGCLLESEAVVPDDYEIFKRHAGLQKDFDAVFTYSDRILNELSNAKFFPIAAAPSFRGKGGIPDTLAYEKKTKNVSFMSSDKATCYMHRYRIGLGWQCKREGLADTYGTFDGGPYARIDEPYETYRYSIVIENDQTPYYFSERLTSCFMAMTVPVYVGALQIDKFFNLDGMIVMHLGDDIRQVLAQCCESDYLQRLEAIKDNFSRAAQYANMWDWLYERYLK